MKIPKVTVSLIADRIWSPHGNLTKPQLIDRLRNWTKEGLLTTTGETNPGTGRHRYYPQWAIGDALLLTVLTDAIGLPAVKARAFAELFNMAKKQLKTDPGKGQLILMGLSRDGQPAKTTLVQSSNLQRELNASDHQVHIVIDLAKIYAILNPPGA